MLDRRIPGLTLNRTEQTYTETNRLFERSYEEFVAHLKRKPVWRAWHPYNSLTDWDLGATGASLDTSVYISPPSSAEQVFQSAGAVNMYGMALRAVTNIPQGTLIMWRRQSSASSCAGSKSMYFRSQLPVGANSGASLTADGYLLAGPVTSPYNLSFIRYDNNVGTTIVSVIGGRAGLSFNTWYQLQFIWWSDPTLGFMLRSNYGTGSGFNKLLNDVADPADHFKTSSLNRVGWYDVYLSGGCGTSNTDYFWYDDFQLYTP